MIWISDDDNNPQSLMCIYKAVGPTEVVQNTGICGQLIAEFFRVANSN